MRVSVVIPTYNRRVLLCRTLEFLAAQMLPEGISLEVVVVDDGSNDATDAAVEEMRAKFQTLLYAYRPREDANVFSLGRARNLGIAKSSGDVICFLDTDILVGPSFISTVAAAIDPHADRVIIHRMLGATMIKLDHLAAVVDRLTPHTFDETAARLSRDFYWRDSREPVMESVGRELMRLPAPWTLGWGGALTVTRQLVDRLGGFEESFDTWGAEDEDFCYRLFLGGAQFVAMFDPCAIHIPHPIQLRRAETSFHNRRMTHSRHFTLETELHPFYTRIAIFNQVLTQLDTLVLCKIIPRYPESLLTWFGESVGARRILLVGTDDPLTIAALPATDVLVPSHAAEALIKSRFPERAVRRLLGCSLPYEIALFDRAIITDFMRVLPPVILSAFLSEMRRVAREVLILFKPDYASAAAELIPGGWADRDQVTRVAAGCGLRLRLREHVAGVDILSLEATG